MPTANNYWRTTGFEAGLATAQVSPPTAVTTTTPVVFPSATTGWDTSAIGRKSILLVINAKRTAQGCTMSVSESATTNGSYTTATTSGDLTKLVASGIQYVSVLRNPAKPFIRVTATGDNAATDFVIGVAAVLLP